ncbi:hypothetical protein MKEN_01345700 [Mycena kentingensis (nom. inval.)]|nr:hypothetical protein MKEN_01345700 [Mycena kentingensis (nom. inval.)]
MSDGRCSSAPAPHVSPAFPMPSAAVKRLRVAICGAGIGGLTLAVALSQYPDIDIELYEAAKSLTELGAGIGLFPRPWRVMRKLGVDQELINTCEIKPKEGAVSSFHYRKSDQPMGFEFSTLITNGSLITLHRADFQSALLSRLPKSCRIVCSKRLRTFFQQSSGPTQLEFEDGTTATCDVLIGADGLKSATRAAMINERIKWMQQHGRWEDATDIAKYIHPSWSGLVAYRSLIPAEKLRNLFPGHAVLTTPTQYLGKEGYVIAYPIQQGRMVNCVAFTCRHNLENTRYEGPWVGPADKAQFAGYFAHWEPEVQALLQVRTTSLFTHILNFLSSVKCVEKPLAWAVHTVRPLPSFVSGRVALLGDAAHAMTPHQGSGAGQAIEDAWILAKLLGNPATTRENVHNALRAFDEARRPLAHRIADGCRENGRYFSLAVDGVDFGNGRQTPETWKNLQQLHALVVKNWEWAWTTSIDSTLEDALQMFEATL